MRNVFLTVLLSALLVAVAGAAASGTHIPNKEAASGNQPTASATGKVNVTIANFQFSPKTVTVPVGTTVVWTNENGRHTVVSDSGAFKSEVLTAGKSFEFTFTKAGKYPYHCSLHGESGGKDMAGTVVVTAK